MLTPPMPTPPMPTPPMPTPPMPTPPMPTPPMPAVVQPAQRDFQLNSEVIIRHVEGKPLVCYYFQKYKARQNGTPDGTIPSDSIAVLLELDAPHLGAGGHCKIDAQNPAGGRLVVYVRRAHLFSAQVRQMARKHVPYPVNARQVRVAHSDRNKCDVVFHYSLEAAQRREQPHGKIPNDELALMTEQVPQAKHWVTIWYNNQNVFVRQTNVHGAAPEEAPPTPLSPLGDIWSSLGEEHLGASYAAAVAAWPGSSIMDVPSPARDWVEGKFAASLRERPAKREFRVSRTCLWRIEEDELASWNARLRRLVNGACGDFQRLMNETDPDVLTGKETWQRIRVQAGPAVPDLGSVILVWRGCGGRQEDIIAMSQGPKLWADQDGGFFGDGHYTAFEATYAAERAREDRRIQSNGNGDKAMILFAMAAARVRVITKSGDYTRGAAHSDYYSRDPLHKTAMLATVDTYFVPVKPEATGVSGAYEHQACPDGDATAHEVIAGDDAQLLPLGVVYYKD